MVKYITFQNVICSKFDIWWHIEGELLKEDQISENDIYFLSVNVCNQNIWERKERFCIYIVSFDWI